MQVWRGIFLAGLFAMSSLSALAGTVHEVHFAQTARVLVWQNSVLLGDGDRVPLLKTEAADTFGSGVLTPIGLESTNSAQTARFEIASNSAFVLETLNADVAHSIRVRLIGSGVNAQARPIPVTTGSGVLFMQSEKTAIQRGTPESQALTLEITWTSPEMPDLWVRAVSS